jgi:hypothetical protein
VKKIHIPMLWMFCAAVAAYILWGLTTSPSNLRAKDGFTARGAPSIFGKGKRSAIYWPNESRIKNPIPCRKAENLCKWIELNPENDLHIIATEISEKNIWIVEAQSKTRKILTEEEQDSNYRSARRSEFFFAIWASVFPFLAKYFNYFSR